MIKVKLESLALDAGIDDELGGAGNSGAGILPEAGDEVEFVGTARVTSVEGESAVIEPVTVNGDAVIAQDEKDPALEELEREEAALDDELKGLG